MSKTTNHVRNATRPLRWRLTTSYVVVTVGTLLIVVLVSGAYVFSRSLGPAQDLTPEFWYPSTAEYAVPTVRRIMRTAPGLLDLWVGTLETRAPAYEIGRLSGETQILVRHSARLDTLILGPDRRVLAASAPRLAPEITKGEVFTGEGVTGLSERIALALAGEDDPDRLTLSDEPAGRIAIVVPIVGETGEKTLGAIVGVVENLPPQNHLFALTMGLASRTLLILLVGGGLLGAVLGSLTADGIVRRFEHLAWAADSWSRGDFSETVDDAGGDELGVLARHLNSMARRLESMLDRRQEIAVHEERNRLARDLHDSAKQQALAASFQLGTALSLIERDPQEARKHVEEADKLVNAVRKELTELVYQLRPPVSDSSQLQTELRNYAYGWSRQTGTPVDIEVQGDCSCPGQLGWALLRILQEALANAARHSGASTVCVALQCGEEIRLTVSDNGCGFDPESVVGRLGLDSMRERTTSLGGAFTLSSTPGGGTTIQVTIPRDLARDIGSEQREQ